MCIRDRLLVSPVSLMEALKATSALASVASSILRRRFEIIAKIDAMHEQPGRAISRRMAAGERLHLRRIGWNERTLSLIHIFYKLQSKEGSKTKIRKGLYKCGACRKPFTVTVGTIFEDSHLPISKWLMAFFIICSSKKSISANQLSRMLKITSVSYTHLDGLDKKIARIKEKN